MRRLLCAAALVLAVSGLGAEEKESLSGTIEILAPAYSPLAAAPGAPVAVISADDIEASGARDLAEVLESQASVVLRRNGGGAGLATASIRGSSANQVLVVVDGIRLNDSRGGAVDLGDIPVDSIERVELLTGGASAIYGPDALGGAIVITTKRAKENRLSVDLANLSYPGAVGASGASALADSQRLSLDAGFLLGETDLVVSASAERGLSAYPYGGAELRKDSAFTGANARLALGLPLAGGRFGLALSGASREAGVAGSTAYPAKATQGDDSLRGSLSFAHDALVGGLLALSATANGSWSRLDYEDPGYGTKDRHDLRSAGVDLRASLFATKTLEIGAGCSGLFEAAESSAFASAQAGQPSRLSLGAYLAPKYLVGDRFVLAPIARFDWADDYAAGFSFLASARWKVLEALELKASGGTAYRAPTFNELYWPFTDYGWGFSAEGNPNLRPESSVSGDLGVVLSLGPFELSGSGFARFVDDLIVWSSDPASKPVNLNRSFMPGASAKATLRIEALSLSGDYEFLNPLDLSGGASISEAPRIESLPRHRLNMAAAWTAASFESRLALRFASDKVSGAKTLPGAVLLDLGAGWRIHEKLKLAIKVENLLDVRYEVVSGYPMPGRSLQSSMRFEL
ncbi:MAG: TonB-dependent receptor [Spirochaetaceae bacterium]|nr:TonB-dependent receptor [Spirochaetaceae bacterium]